MTFATARRSYARAGVPLVLSRSKTTVRGGTAVRWFLQSMPDCADIALANQIRRLTVEQSILLIYFMSPIDASASMGCV